MQLRFHDVYCHQVIHFCGKKSVVNHTTQYRYMSVSQNNEQNVRHNGTNQREKRTYFHSLRLETVKLQYILMQRFCTSQKICGNKYLSAWLLSSIFDISCSGKMCGNFKRSLTGKELNKQPVKPSEFCPVFFTCSTEYSQV